MKQHADCVLPARASSFMPMTGIQHRQSMAMMTTNHCAKAWSCHTCDEQRGRPEELTTWCSRIPTFWRQQGPPEQCTIPTTLHSIITQKTSPND